MIRPVLEEERLFAAREDQLFELPHPIDTAAADVYGDEIIKPAADLVYVPEQPPAIIEPPRIAYKMPEKRESRHDLFLLSHPEAAPMMTYPTMETKPAAEAPKKNLLDRFFDWLNKVLSGG